MDLPNHRRGFEAQEFFSPRSPHKAILASKTGDLNRISRHCQTGINMISSAKVNWVPARLKVPELESFDASGASESASPELKMAAPTTPPSLKMRHTHASPSRIGKIPTLDDISSISCRLFPKESSQGEVDEVDDAMSIDDVLTDALLASQLDAPPYPSSDQHKLTLGPPLPRPPSFCKIGTDSCWQKTIPHHVTPPTSSNSTSSSMNVDQASQNKATNAAPSSSCSVGFIGGTANSAFATSHYHGATPKKGKV